MNKRHLELYLEERMKSLSNEKARYEKALEQSETYASYVVRSEGLSTVNRLIGEIKTIQEIISGGND